MKHQFKGAKGVVVLGLCMAAAGLSVKASATMRGSVPHLDLELSGEEYRTILETLPTDRKTLHPREFFSDHSLLDSGTEDAQIEQWLLYGKRNLQWLDLINSKRSVADKISLSSIATQGGSPVTAPVVYNFEIIQDKWNILRALLPPELSGVVFDGAAPTDTNPLTDREFIEWMRQVDAAYQQAARYKIMKPNKTDMIEGAGADVRGYLRIIGDSAIDDKLKNFSSQDPAVQSKLTADLVLLCRNGDTKEADCQSGFSKSLVGKNLVAYKNQYLPNAKKNYESFFKIGRARKDITWTSANANVLSIPFRDPANDTVKAFLQTNIEDEWKWTVGGKPWNLRLQFNSDASSSNTHVVFVPGSTPHVNGQSGSEITMDANSPLSEYNVQWTIRHEYGHVLGFPDCYLEFYDLGQDAFVSYQLDVTDVMCSRRGHFQQQHYDELKRAYFKQL